VNQDTLFDLFQWLYQELILKLSSELNNADLVKYLNYKLLLKYPELADFLSLKHKIDTFSSTKNHHFYKENGNGQPVSVMD
jgi:hypothetical protein